MFHFIKEFSDWFGTHPKENQLALALVVNGIAEEEILGQDVQYSLLDFVSKNWILMYWNLYLQGNVCLHF